MILTHIHGINELILKKTLEDYNNLIQYINVDDETDKVINSVEMNKLFDEYDTLYEKSKIDISNKSLITKYKNIEKTMINLWKNHINNFIKSVSKNCFKKYIIVFGNIIHPRNSNTFIKINAITKFIINNKISTKVKNIIQKNIDEYRDDIINGKFPINYISYDYLYNKYKTENNTYILNNYHYKTDKEIIDNIITHIKFYETNTPKNKKLYVITKNNYYDIIPKINNLITAYDNELNAIYNLFSNIKVIDKLTINISNDELDTECYIYMVDRSDFMYIGDKYITSNDCKILEKYHIEKISDRLKQYKVKVIN